MALPKKMPLNIVSAYRAPIYGISIIWIMLFHAAAINKFDYSLGHDDGFFYHFGLVMGLGNTGVDVFLLLSGICLYFSFVKNPDGYVFLKKRFARLIIPVWIIDGIYWLVRCVILEGGTLWDFLSRITLLRFWLTGDQTIWFVSVIAVLYLSYPLVYRFVFKPRSDGLILARGAFLVAASFALILVVQHCCPALYNITEIGLTRIPVFFVGCILGKFVYEKREIPWIVGIIVIIVCLVILYAYSMADSTSGCPKMNMRLVKLLGGVGLAYLFALIFWGLDSLFKNRTPLINRFFGFAGGFSLELYLCHITANQIYRITPLNHGSSIAWYLGMLVIAFVMAWLLGKLTKWINGRLLRAGK